MLSRANGFIEPCFPSSADKPPSGPEWVHEIKHDGYRDGHDWSPRYPLIVKATAVAGSNLRTNSFVAGTLG